jgi:membrane associated rhomboid family serine protease
LPNFKIRAQKKAQDMTGIYKDNAFECKRINKSYETAERSSILYPLIGAFIMPIAIGLFFPSMITLIHLIILLTVVLIPSIAITSFVYTTTSGNSLKEYFSIRFSFIPAGMVYSNDLKMNAIPWVTIVLVVLNTGLFLMVPPDALDRFIFPPYGNHTALDFVISIITSAFLHGSFWHLLGNMVFLWAFASALEPRIGARRFIAVYFISILFSTLIPVLLYNFQEYLAGPNKVLRFYSSLGASGAIAGIMGLFAVRCFFAKVKIALPVILVPLVSVPVRVNGLLLCGMFFALDISSSVGMFNGKPGGVNYWAHVGGFMFGILMGYYMKLHKDASVESVSVKANRFSKEEAGLKDAADVYTDLLKEKPYDESALRFMLHRHRFNLKTAESYFIRLMQVLIKKDIKQAQELFEEHYPNFIGSIPGSILFVFGMYYYKRADFIKSRHCFEFANEIHGAWNAKSTLQLGRTFEAIGNKEMAHKQYDIVIDSFPGSDFAKEAKEELKYPSG